MSNNIRRLNWFQHGGLNMFCKFCGNQIDDTSTICSCCGKNVKDTINSVSDVSNENNVEIRDTKIIFSFIISIIVGGIIGFITIFFGEGAMILLASIVAGIIFALIAYGMSVRMNIRGVIAFASFLLFCFLYAFLFFTIEEYSINSNIQDIGMFFYLCSPYSILIYIWSESTRKQSNISRLSKVLLLWIILLAVLFGGYKIAAHKDIDPCVVDKELQKDLFEILPEAASIGIEDDGEKYKIYITDTKSASDLANVMKAINVCKEHASTIYIYLYSPYGNLKYIFENDEERYVLQTQDKKYYQLSEDEFILCLEGASLETILKREDHNKDTFAKNEVSDADEKIQDNASTQSTDIPQPTELEQKLFDYINYASDMSQDDIRAIYDAIGDGSFFSGTYFEYVTEYGKDRYNYEICYDGLTVTVYCDYIENIYGFDISTEYVP